MLNNIPTISTTEALDMLRDAFKVSGLGFDGSYSGLPVVLYGQAGCGKTYVVRQLAQLEGAQYKHLEAIHYSPTDAAGARTIDIAAASDYLKQYLPDWCKGLDPDKPAVINADEITKGVRAVIAALLGILNERRVGSFEFGRHWLFVLSGNLASARSGDVELLGATRNRCAQFIVANTARQFLDNYAYPNNLHPWVTSFIERYEDSPDFPKGVLNTWDGDENPAAFASERSWTTTSRVCSSVANPSLFAYSLLGNELGNAFTRHVKLHDKIATKQEVLDSPETARMPDEVALCYYVGSYVASWATPEYMPQIATYLRRMPAEAGATAMQEVVKRHPDCKTTRDYIAFRTEYSLTL